MGWLLAGVGEHPATRDTWVFKGGTCLKKCFFETYRFSEDLDFTLTDPSHLDEAFLRKLFEEVGEWVYDQVGLVLPPEARKFDVYTNPRGGTSAEGRVGYRGPLGRAGDAPRVKLDLTDHERLVLPIDRRDVHHPYSDRPLQGIQVSSYCFEEVFAEKVCVQLTYRDASGTPSQPVIEPYSLRRTLDANYLLYGVKAETGEDRSCRVDRISAATVTPRAFKARYLVELTETGFQAVRDTPSRPVAAVESFRLPRATSSPRKTANSGGPKYVYRCTVCDKTFTRSTFGATLNEHKNKQGYPCFGRLGTLVKTQY